MKHFIVLFVIYLMIMPETQKTIPLNDGMALNKDKEREWKGATVA